MDANGVATDARRKDDAHVDCDGGVSEGSELCFPVSTVGGFPTYVEVC